MTKKEDKIQVMMTITDFLDKSDFEGTIEEVAERIKSIPKRFLKLYPYRTDIKNAHKFVIYIDNEQDYGEYCGHDVFCLKVYRWETDEERDGRIELATKRSTAAKEGAEKRKLAAAKREKTLYESLKKKFES